MQDPCCPHFPSRLKERMPLLSHLLTARVNVVDCFPLLFNVWQFTTAAVLVLNVSFIHPFLDGECSECACFAPPPHTGCVSFLLWSGNVTYNPRLQRYSLPRRSTYVFFPPFCFLCSFGTFLFLLPPPLSWAYWITMFRSVPYWSLGSAVSCVEGPRATESVKRTKHRRSLNRPFETESLRRNTGGPRENPEKAVIFHQEGGGVGEVGPLVYVEVSPCKSAIKRGSKKYCIL